MGGCYGNCVADGSCNSCGFTFCSYDENCDHQRYQYQFEDNKYCLRCFETLRDENQRLKDKIKELTDSINKKYEKKIDEEILNDILSEIKKLVNSESDDEKESDDESDESSGGDVN